jgi:hypothetical protein
MEAIIPIVVVSIVLLIIGFGIYFGHKYEKERTARFEAIALEMGLQFFPEGESAVISQFSSTHLFQQGRRRKFRNMICGDTDALKLAVFGYQYTVGNGKNSHTHHQSVMAFQSSSLELPEFELRPEHFFHKIGKALGYQDINFDAHPVFSKQFILRGPDEQAIRLFFTPERLKALESRPGISIESGKTFLVFYRQRKRVKPEELRAFMQEGFEIHKVICGAAS